MMIEHFESFISSRVSLTKEELKLVSSLAVEKKLRRRQLLLHEGEICRFKSFVVRGLLKTSRIKMDGSEHIMRFAPERTWTMDAESYNNNLPSKFNIEALEDSEVVMFSRESMTEIFTTIAAFKQYSEKLIADTLEASQNRVLMHISYTAEEKYQDFIRGFPDVFDRVPLHMVASYLGLSRETLSRVRHAQRKRQNIS